MTAPNAVPEHGAVPKLARKWANAASTTAHIPLQADEFETRLVGLLGVLCMAVLTEPVNSDAAFDCGAALVEVNCTGPDSLLSTMDTLAAGLPRLPDLAGLPRLTERVATVLGALAAGYADAITRFRQSQQESVSQAALRALATSQRDQRLAMAKLSHVLAAVPSGIAFVTETGQFRDVNQAFAEILGYRLAELDELTLFDVFPAPDAAWLSRTLAENPDVRRKQRLVRQDGEEIWTQLRLSMPERDVLLVLIEDRTEVELLQSHMNLMSLHDPQTRLPNRQYLTTRLERATGQVAVYHLDLDDFTPVSRGLGRAVGDLALSEVGRRLQTLVSGEKAMVARLSADEFAVLTENSPASTVDMIEAIQREVRKPIKAAEHDLVLSACVGVGHGLAAAELALARAKRTGPGQWAVFDPVRDNEDRAALALAATLSGAWDSGQFAVRYHPLLQLTSRKVVGLDTVLSWSHPKHGRHTHVDGLRLLRLAGAQRRELPVHVGLTPSQANDPDLVGRVLGILGETSQPPAAVWLGFPASALVGGGEAADSLTLLADAGVRAELRDFGNSAGDLVNVVDLPVQAVRLAPRLATQQTDAVRRILDFAHLAGATVITDNPGSQRWQDFGVDVVRGDFFVP